MPCLSCCWARKPLGSLRPWSGVQMWVSPFVSGVPNHTRVFDSTVTFRLLFRSLLPAIRSPICRSPKSIFIASTSDCRQPLAVSRRRSVAPSSFFVFLSFSRVLAVSRCSMFVDLPNFAGSFRSAHSPLLGPSLVRNAVSVSPSSSPGPVHELCVFCPSCDLAPGD